MHRYVCTCACAYNWDLYGKEDSKCTNEMCIYYCLGCYSMIDAQSIAIFVYLTIKI